MLTHTRKNQPMPLPTSSESGTFSGGDLVSSSATIPHPDGVDHSILTSPFSYEVNCGSDSVVEQYSVKVMDCATDV